MGEIKDLDPNALLLPGNCGELPGLNKVSGLPALIGKERGNELEAADSPDGIAVGVQGATMYALNARFRSMQGMLEYRRAQDWA